jgi:hypothetical protein
VLPPSGVTAATAPLPELDPLEQRFHDNPQRPYGRAIESDERESRYQTDSDLPPVSTR